MATDVRDDRNLPLAGKRILLIEDEYYIADDVRRILRSSGADIVGPVGSVADAQRAVDDGPFDCVVLDLNLHDQSALPVADRLVAEGFSFVIATGYGSPALPAHLKDVPRIEKPFDPPALIQLVTQMACSNCPSLARLRRAATGSG